MTKRDWIAAILGMCFVIAVVGYLTSSGIGMAASDCEKFGAFSHDDKVYTCQERKP